MMMQENFFPDHGVASTDEELRLLLEHAKEYAIVLLDPSGHVSTWNQSAARLKGYSATEIIGQHFSRFYSPEDVVDRRPWRMLETAREQGRVEDEGWRVRKDGTRFWANVVITALRDSEGVLRGFGKLVRDMTEQRVAQLVERQYMIERERAAAGALFTERSNQMMRTLRESEAHFKLILNSTAEGIYVLDADGKCTFCNTAATEMFGFPSATFPLGRNFHELVHHHRTDGSAYAIEECAIHGTFSGHRQHVDLDVFWRLDNTSFPVEYFSYPIAKEGQVIGAVITFLDITDRLRAREALAEKEMRFRQLAEATFDGISISEDGVIIEANTGFSRIFGYELSEVVGKTTIEFIAEESRPTVRERISNNIEGRYEAVGKHRDGHRLLLEIAGRTHYTGKGIARISAIRDLTEQRQLEVRLRQTQKMEAIGRLAGGVAHDFNNLLTVIMSYADMLLITEDNESHREDLQEIRQATQSAAALTRQLLAFSRQQVIEPKMVDLSELVRNSAKMVQRLIGEDVELAVSAQNPLTVKVDAGQIDQVLLNLAANARDAMPEGGLLTVETASVVLDDDYARGHWPAVAGHFAMLAITDTGMGMDKETQARIFEPFFTTKEAGKGTGLGLATVYGIVKQSDGFIWVYSEPGRGTTFKIYFPLQKEAAPVEISSPEPAVSGAGGTILLTEDEPAVRVAARRILEQNGFTVLEAPTPRAALDTATRYVERIDLLLTDLVMPGMNGSELAEEFRSVRPETKVLFMSGYTADAVVRRGIFTAGGAYIQKPFSGDTLVRKIREVLG
jgi:two-component system, cell cycle sensor histidine kinase and response regulator CckA